MIAWPVCWGREVLSRGGLEPGATLVAVGGERCASWEDGVVMLRKRGIDRVVGKRLLWFLFFLFVFAGHLVECGLVIL